jgi:hypothetical protein
MKFPTPDGYQEILLARRKLKWPVRPRLCVATPPSITNGCIANGVTPCHVEGARQMSPALGERMIAQR